MNERASLNLPDQIQKMLSGSIPPPPIANLIGFKVTSIKSGKAVIEFEAGEKHANPMGTLHGGVLCDISDAAMGMAYASMLKEGESFTTLELKINFLKPIWKAKLRAEGSVVNGGRTVGLVMCDVFDGKRHSGSHDDPDPEPQRSKAHRYDNRKRSYEFDHEFVNRLGNDMGLIRYLGQNESEG